MSDLEQEFDYECSSEAIILCDLLRCRAEDGWRVIGITSRRDEFAAFLQRDKPAKEF